MCCVCNGVHEKCIELNWAVMVVEEKFPNVCVLDMKSFTKLFRFVWFLFVRSLFFRLRKLMMGSM
jgi:hypothetical protein